MNEMQPIRDIDKINCMKQKLIELGGANGVRDRMLFLLGINTANRISDLLSLKVSDLKGKTHMTITEKKTGKFKRFLINDNLQKEIQNYTKNMKDEEFMFASKKLNNKPITANQFKKELNYALDRENIKELGIKKIKKVEDISEIVKKYKSDLKLNEESIEKLLDGVKDRGYIYFLILKCIMDSRYSLEEILNWKAENINSRTRVSKILLQELKKYIDKEGFKEDEYLFKLNSGESRPITSIQAWKILKRASEECGINSFGTHSLRKTFGYWFYKRNPNKLAELMRILNHSSIQITLMYVGILQDDQDNLIEQFSL